MRQRPPRDKEPRATTGRACRRAADASTDRIRASFDPTTSARWVDWVTTWPLVSRFGLVSGQSVWQLFDASNTPGRTPYVGTLQWE